MQESTTSESPSDALSAVAEASVGGVVKSEKVKSGPLLTAILTDKGLDLVLSDPDGDGTEVMSNADYHALFIRDTKVVECLEHFREATSQFRSQDLTSLSSSSQLPTGSTSLTPFRDRLKNDIALTKVLFTSKKTVPAHLKPGIRKCVDFLSTRLGLSNQDKLLILGALEIHNLAKLWHHENDPVGFKSKPELYGKRLRLINEQPSIVRMLLAMYANVNVGDSSENSIEVTGGNILTAADMISECFDPEEPLSYDDSVVISRELRLMTGTLLLSEVAEALVFLLEKEAPRRDARERGNRVLIYTDSPEQIYSLENRLRNEKMRITICDRIQTFLTSYKRRQPDIIILRLNCAPLLVIRVLQFISCNGLNISSVPFFLLVKKVFIPRLQILLKTGIEDIFDGDESLDLLVLKLKKIQAQLSSASTAAPEPAQQQCGSRGKLSDMSLIDLMQALGPSRRTSRVTVSAEDAPSEKLVIYLDQGSITFAQLGETLGAPAIHRALAWKSGNWVVEQVTEAELPVPNNQLPNDAILMEGCRLLDETARV